ncbi:inorganic pyrophosphatase [Chlamydoabsidia padenii]|nr:inorganic pyrophosphatase [Chlamydoabsidia padenii]
MYITTYIGLVSLSTLFSLVLGNSADGIRTRKIGSPFTTNYSIYFENEQGVVISPFHDIPLYADANNDTIYNMVVEIPRWTNAKFEINKETPLNPIKQDLTKDNHQPRYVPNLYPLKGYPWNYGALPQTWEDPHHKAKDTGAIGDNDPIDVIEIGDKVGETGEIKQVKLLGVFGLIDQDETDWKLVMIDVNDHQANVINDINDVETYKPGLLKDTARFFRLYKVPQGKKENKIIFNNEPQNKAYATRLVIETHDYWNALINGTSPKDNIHTENLTVKKSPYRISPDASIVTSVPPNHPLPPAEIPSSVETWSFVK